MPGSDVSDPHVPEAPRLDVVTVVGTPDEVMTPAAM